VQYDTCTEYLGSICAITDDALDALAADEPVRPPLLEDAAALEALDALWAE
jgi:hypothetical protein